MAAWAPGDEVPCNGDSEPWNCGQLSGLCEAGCINIKDSGMARCCCGFGPGVGEPHSNDCMPQKGMTPEQLRLQGSSSVPGGQGIVAVWPAEQGGTVQPGL